MTRLHAVLPPRPGINATYRSGRGGLYRTVRGMTWRDIAMMTLRAAGWRVLPPDRYWVRLRLHLHSIRLDLGAPLKLAIDTMLKGALGIDDRDLGELVGDLLPAPSREERESRAVAAVDGVSMLTGGRR